MKFEIDSHNRNVPEEELLQDLITANAKCLAQGKKFTYRSYLEFGKYSPGTIFVRFGTWNDGLRRAGIAPTVERNVPVEALFDNLKLVWIAKGKQPVFRDMCVHPSLYRASIYVDRFGGWRNALKEFVRSVDQEHFQLNLSDTEVQSGQGTKRTKRDPSLALRFFVLQRDHFRCVACGRSPAMTAGLVLEIDHSLAWSKGGETIKENLKTLCFDCNRGKGAV